MNSSNDDHQIDERHHDANVDEVLVAYLDGQLAAEESERIESQLSSDPVVRQRMQELDRVWNALDVLPRSTASPAFTRSTVEMAAVSASRAKPLEGGGRVRKRLPAGAIACLLGLFFGAAMTYVVAGTPERRALRDLPTAIHASALENAGSIDFLLQLTAQADKELKLFLTDEIRAEARDWGEVSAMTQAERRQWLAALPAEELTEVNTAVDRFQDRSPLQQESLRALSTDLSEEEQAESLLQAAVVYQSIVSQLPSSEQATLRQMEAEGRLRLVRKNAGRLAREAVLRLSGQQRADLRAAIEKLVRSEAFKREAEELTERLPPGRKDRRREEIARRQPQLILLTTTRFVARPRRGQEFSGRRGERLPPELRTRMQEGIERFETEVAEPITVAWSGWADRLQEALPESTQRALNEAAVKGEAERARLFERLLLEAAPEDLSDTFSDLPESEIERLLLMPRDRFVEELSEQEAAGLNFETRPPHERDFGRPPGRSGEDRRGGRGPGSGEFGERPFGEGPPPRREPPSLGREG